MSDKQPETVPAERWYQLALEDLAAAEVLIADTSTALRIVGFLSQQAAEKALKACLLSVGVVPPRIHSLRQLKNQIPIDNRLFEEDDLDVLDPWIIDGRYAADLPDVEINEARNLIDAARRIVGVVGRIIQHN